MAGGVWEQLISTSLNINIVEETNSENPTHEIPADAQEVEEKLQYNYGRKYWALWASPPTVLPELFPNHEPRL